jgi:predicted O-methyltransferase YrrM
VFYLDFENIELIHGLSNDSIVLKKLENEKYDLVCIDGDHQYEAVCNDIRNFSQKIEKGGFLVMDDASCNIPGTKFWKGHQSVSNACDEIKPHIFKNVLNVGHNRIFQRV